MEEGRGSMPGFSRVGDTLHCGPFSLPDLAERHGTPLYVYSIDTVRDRYERLTRAFAAADPVIAYSVKANGNLALLNRLGVLGAGADVVSGGELFRARKAGISPDKIFFAGVAKSDQELEAGLTAGIHAFHVETTSELHRLESLAAEKGRRAPFGVRVNPDVLAPTPHEYTRTGHAGTKFGIPIPVAVGLYRWAATRPHLRARGIDVHIGSQVRDPAPYKRTLRQVLEVVHLLQKEGIALQYLDLGGGFGIRDEDEGMDMEALAEGLLPILATAGLRLILEPGRFLVGEAGILLTRVQGVKRSGDKTFVITDAGMNDLLRPSHYRAYHPVEAVVEMAGRDRREVDVVGPVCETGDLLAWDRTLALPKAGELLAVRNVGAYGFSMASNYNARCRPAEVMVEGEDAYLVRARETHEDLVRGEVIP